MPPEKGFAGWSVGASNMSDTTGCVFDQVGLRRSPPILIEEGQGLWVMGVAVVVVVVVVVANPATSKGMVLSARAPRLGLGLGFDCVRLKGPYHIEADANASAQAQRDHSFFDFALCDPVQVAG